MITSLLFILGMMFDIALTVAFIGAVFYFAWQAAVLVDEKNKNKDA